MYGIALLHIDIFIRYRYDFKYTVCIVLYIKVFTHWYYYLCLTCVSGDLSAQSLFNT